MSLADQGLTTKSVWQFKEKKIVFQSTSMMTAISSGDFDLGTTIK